MCREHRFQDDVGARRRFACAQRLHPLIILLFTIFPKKMMRLVVGAVGLLAKMHIVKRKYHATKKCVNGLLEYSGAMKLFAKKFLQCLPLVLLCVIETLLNYAIPFFVVLAVGHDVKPTFELLMQILCLSTLTRYTALLIPTPATRARWKRRARSSFPR